MWLVQYWIEANGILLPIIDLKCSFNGYGLSISSILLPAFSLSSSPIIANAIHCANEKTSHSKYREERNILLLLCFISKKLHLNDGIQFNVETVLNAAKWICDDEKMRLC